jgi:hypothetical protein
MFAKQHRLFRVVIRSEQPRRFIGEMAFGLFATLDADRAWMFAIALLFPPLAAVTSPSAPEPSARRCTGSRHIAIWRAGSGRCRKRGDAGGGNAGKPSGGRLVALVERAQFG